MKVDWVIVGAGFTGVTLAERLATQLGKTVLVVERRDHIGGNAYDFYDEHGVLVHKYGPHIFHTSSDRVWKYLSQFTEWRPYYHHVRGIVDGRQVPIPFNLNSLRAVFPEDLARRLENDLVNRFGFGRKVPILRLREVDDSEVRALADYIYEKVFLRYTLKQWGFRPEELDASVTGRVPVHVSRDDRYFQDPYQAMPRHGYTQMFRRMLNHPGIRLLLNSDFLAIEADLTYEHAVFTGAIDEFFGWRHGTLPYRSLKFEFTNFPGELVQEVGTVNYPSEQSFTRTTEQKHLTGQKGPTTTIVTEYPQEFVPGRNAPYYPVPREENRELYQRYASDALREKGRVRFAGRLADYKYYNMDQACARALALFDEIARETQP